MQTDILRFGCVECGETINADIRPLCPNCGIDLHKVETVKTVDSDILKQVEMTIRNVKSELHYKYNEMGVNLNNIQYAIRTERVNDASPVVKKDEFNVSKIPLIIYALNTAIEELEKLGYKTEANHLQSEVEKIEELIGTFDIEQTHKTGSTSIYNSKDTIENCVKA